jgi:hypothetical protein
MLFVTDLQIHTAQNIYLEFLDENVNATLRSVSNDVCFIRFAIRVQLRTTVDAFSTRSHPINYSQVVYHWHQLVDKMVSQ